jgi:hypothetical protein
MSGRAGGAPRAQQPEAMFDLWLQCYTQDEIAEAVGVSQMEVSREVGESNKTEALPKGLKPSRARMGGW